MKKNKFYLLAMMLMAMLCIGFVSCDKEDLQEEEVTNSSGDEEITGEGLAGTWRFVIVENYYKNGKSDRIDYTQYSSYYKQYCQFDGNGKGILYEWEQGNGWYVDPFSYTYDGTYIIGLDEDGGKIEVLKLTSTELVLKISEYLDDETVEYMVQTYKRVKDSAVKDAK